LLPIGFCVCDQDVSDQLRALTADMQAAQERLTFTSYDFIPAIAIPCLVIRGKTLASWPCSADLVAYESDIRLSTLVLNRFLLPQLTCACFFGTHSDTGIDIRINSKRILL
jgi:hypothetical protein